MSCRNPICGLHAEFFFQVIQILANTKVTVLSDKLLHCSCITDLISNTGLLLCSHYSIVFVFFNDATVRCHSYVHNGGHFLIFLSFAPVELTRFDIFILLTVCHLWVLTLIFASNRGNTLRFSLVEEESQMVVKSQTSCWRSRGWWARMRARGTSTFTIRSEADERHVAATDQSYELKDNAKCHRNVKNNILVGFIRCEIELFLIFIVPILRFIFNFSSTCTVVFQLIEGSSAQQKEGLGLMTPDYYYYLNQSGTYKVDGTNDSKDFQETMVHNCGVICNVYVIFKIILSNICIFLMN